LSLATFYAAKNEYTRSQQLTLSLPEKALPEKENFFGKEWIQNIQGVVSCSETSH